MGPKSAEPKACDKENNGDTSACFVSGVHLCPLPLFLCVKRTHTSLDNSKAIKVTAVGKYRNTWPGRGLNVHLKDVGECAQHPRDVTLL